MVNTRLPCNPWITGFEMVEPVCKSVTPLIAANASETDKPLYCSRFLPDSFSLYPDMFSVLIPETTTSSSASLLW